MTSTTLADELRDTASDELGSAVWDALVDAGFEPYHETGDGFDVLANPDDPTHVLVLSRQEGALRGESRMVVRQILAPLKTVLLDAKFAARVLEVDGEWVGVVAALEEAHLPERVGEAVSSNGDLLSAGAGEV